MWFSAHLTIAVVMLGLPGDATANAAAEAAPQAARVFARAASVSESAVGADETKSPVALNQVWLISTRGADCGCSDPPRLRYWQYDHARNAWTPSKRETFLATDDPGVPTCFYVHGNRIGWSDSAYNGWTAYRRMAQQATGRPFRFVIWSWPSSQISGQLRDVREKAWRSDAQGYHLAWLLDQMNPAVRVSLLGYSYGARIITGSLHLLGGGRVSGRQLARQGRPAHVPYRAVLMAAALDNYWLQPGSRHGRAMSQVDQMLITKNPADPALRWYHMLYGLRARTSALGYTGVAGYNRLGAEGSKITQVNVSGWVGEYHDWTRYLRSPTLLAMMRPYAFFESDAKN